MKYNITAFHAFKAPFQSRAGMLQRYYLTIDGFDPSKEPIAWDKKADAGPPSIGEIEGELVATATKAGKPYYKFKKSYSDSGFSQPMQTALPAPLPTQNTDGLDGLRRTLETALQQLRALQARPSVGVSPAGTPKVQEFSDGSPVPTEAPGDVVLDYLPDDEPVDLSEIPF